MKVLGFGFVLWLLVIATVVHAADRDDPSRDERRRDLLKWFKDTFSRRSATRQSPLKRYLKVAKAFAASKINDKQTRGVAVETVKLLRKALDAARQDHTGKVEREILAKLKNQVALRILEELYYEVKTRGKSTPLQVSELEFLEDMWKTLQKINQEVLLPLQRNGGSDEPDRSNGSKDGRVRQAPTRDMVRKLRTKWRRTWGYHNGRGEPRPPTPPTSRKSYYQKVVENTDKTQAGRSEASRNRLSWGDAANVGEMSSEQDAAGHSRSGFGTRATSRRNKPSSSPIPTRSRRITNV